MSKEFDERKALLFEVIKRKGKVQVLELSKILEATGVSSDVAKGRAHTIVKSIARDGNAMSKMDGRLTYAYSIPYVNKHNITIKRPVVKEKEIVDEPGFMPRLSHNIALIMSNRASV